MLKQVTNLERIGLGTAQLGFSYGVANKRGQVISTEAREMVRRAAFNKIGLIDTAIAYGDSENRLGAIGVRNFRVVTKLPAIPAGIKNVRSYILDEVAASLKRLGLKTVYALLLHKPEQLLGADGPVICQSLRELKESGQVLKVGVSVYAPSELESLSRRLQYDIVQLPLNLVDRRFQTSGWLRRLKVSGVEVHARSAFLQGLLLMPKEELPEWLSHWQCIWSVWHEWLSERRVSALQVCLAYVLSISEIDKVIVGMDSVHQLEQLIMTLKKELISEFPNLQCDDEDLINPSKWIR
jgi:aryl-alcohol dehydrogenase-like predicted oxidoreductase